MRSAIFYLQMTKVKFQICSVFEGPHAAAAPSPRTRARRRRTQAASASAAEPRVKDQTKLSCAAVP